MSNTEDMVKALYKVAVNQQKIINKLAQQAGVSSPDSGGASTAWDDVSNAVAEEVKKAALKCRVDPKSFYVNPDHGAYVYNKTTSSKGELEGKVFYTNVETTLLDDVKEAFNALVKGKSLKTNDGKDSEVVVKFNMPWGQMLK